MCSDSSMFYSVWITIAFIWPPAFISIQTHFLDHAWPTKSWGKSFHSPLIEAQGVIKSSGRVYKCPGPIFSQPFACPRIVTMLGQQWIAWTMGTWFQDCSAACFMADAGNWVQRRRNLAIWTGCYGRLMFSFLSQTRKTLWYAVYSFISKL